MRRHTFLLTLIAATPLAFGAEEISGPPVASNPVVNFTGAIQKIQLAPGEGMPFLEVKSGSQVTRVYLGSIRYLMEQNFNPKAGVEVTVTGYKMNPEVVAISVTLVAEKRTLKLRDEKGWPLWRGGRMMHGGRGGMR